MILYGTIQLIFGAQDCNKDTSLAICFDQKSISSKAVGEDISLTFEFINSTDSNYLFYGLTDKLSLYEKEMSFYCDGDVVAGLELFVFDINNTMVVPEIRISPPSEIDYKPITPEDMINEFRKFQKKFRETMVALKKGGNERFTQTVNLEKYHLNKGEYYLQVLYYSGKNLQNIVAQELIQEDCMENSASVFYGCVLSEKVTLLVE